MSIDILDMIIHPQSTACQVCLISYLNLKSDSSVGGSVHKSYAYFFLARTWTIAGANDSKDELLLPDRELKLGNNTPVRYLPYTHAVSIPVANASSCIIVADWENVIDMLTLELTATHVLRRLKSVHATISSRVWQICQLCGSYAQRWPWFNRAHECDQQQWIKWPPTNIFCREN